MSEQLIDDAAVAHQAGARFTLTSNLVRVAFWWVAESPLTCGCRGWSTEAACWKSQAPRVVIMASAKTSKQQKSMKTPKRMRRSRSTRAKQSGGAETEQDEGHTVHQRVLEDETRSDGEAPGITEAMEERRPRGGRGCGKGHLRPDRRAGTRSRRRPRRPGLPRSFDEHPRASHDHALSLFVSLSRPGEWL